MQSCSPSTAIDMAIISRAQGGRSECLGEVSQRHGFKVPTKDIGTNTTKDTPQDVLKESYGSDKLDRISRDQTVTYQIW